MEEEDEAERRRRGDAPPSRGLDSEACRADRARGKLAPCQDVLLSPSSITERSIQAHSGGAAGDCFEVIGDGSALAPTTLPPSLSLLALPPELLTLVAEQLDAPTLTLTRTLTPALTLALTLTPTPTLTLTLP